MTDTHLHNTDKWQKDYCIRYASTHDKFTHINPQKQKMQETEKNHNEKDFSSKRRLFATNISTFNSIVLLYISVFIFNILVMC